MALITNFNQDPYYDDFDDDKNYYRVLFKPGNAVQARELTQLQTNLQDQIKKFGDHIFKTGSIVTGGQITIQNTTYLNISSTYSGQDISYLNFDKQIIINTANTKRAYVLKSYPASVSDNQPITFIINQMYGDPFTSDESFYTSNNDVSSIVYYANTASSNVTGNCQSFSVNEGVFYYDGFFVKTQPQTVAINKYSLQGSAIVGFNVNEDLIDYSEDTTLLDPAQGSSNFQAPGADRYKIEMVLDTRSVDSTDLKQFIELGTVQDGVPLKVAQTPIYAAIGDELARRTEDESGDYVIKNFAIELNDSAANSAYSNISLGSGKAYIKGYEFRRDAPTIITVPKPRTTESVSNRRIEVDYGYYIFANSLFGNFATNQYSNVELSLLNTGQANAYLNAGNTAIYSNTVIGNTKVKLVSFYSVSANTLESNNYIYKVFLTDINTRSIGANGGYGVNATSGSATTIVLPSGYAANNDVYKGLSIRIVGGAPFNTPSDNTARIITDYVGSTLTATVSPPFSSDAATAAAAGNFRFVIDPKFVDVESLVTRSASGLRIASANVSPLSKDRSYGSSATSITQSKLFQPTIINESKREPLLIKIGENNIADNTIRDFSYSYRRLYQTVTFTSGVSQSLSLGTGETLQSAATSSSKQEYYQIVVTNQGTGIHVKGKTVPAQQFSVDTASRTISVDGGENMTANIYAVVNASNPTSKTKTFIPANTKLVDPSWGLGLGTYISVFGTNASGNTNANIAPYDGQTIINQNIVERKPGAPQYLYVTDVHSINAIFDLNGSNVSTSVYNSLTEASNVTSRYVLNTGQKDSYYEWASITLKPGQNAPIGPLVVRYNRFTSNGSGYFDIDSYTRLGSQEKGGQGLDYGLVPIFTTQDGAKIPLKDYLDFRPVRADATSTYRANNFVLNVDEAVLGPQIAEPGLDIITDYEYYLPRIDRVVLNKSREFQVLQGIPAINPVVPIEPTDSMTLYVLSYPPYTTFTNSATIQTFNHRRYTMRDIARLDKRISNLELYTSLSIAELATINKNDRTVRDSVGLSRPKNGVFVDSFVDKAAAAITQPDFDAAIDIVSRLCRGSFNLNSTTIFSNNSISNQNIEINGPLLLLSSSNTTFVSQNRASKTMNINPFNIVNYIGTVKLDPPSDVWRSETRLESQNIDLSGGQEAADAWSAMEFKSYGYWNTEVIGVSKQVLDKSTKIDVTSASGKYAAEASAQFEKTGKASSVAGGTGAAIKGDVDYITTTNYLETQTLEKTRTNLVTTITPKQLTESFGDRLVDVSVVQYMREKNILILGTKFKPFTTLNAFFDNVNVNDNIAKINRFEMTQNKLKYKTTIADAETVTFYKVSDTSGLKDTDIQIGTGKVVLTSSKNAFIVSITPEPTFGSWIQCTPDGIWIKGDVTGQVYRTTNWIHQSGIARAGGATTISLAHSVGGASNATDYVGKTIRIIAGKGKGQSATISNYTFGTGVADIDGTWKTNPDSTSVYTIGTLETTKEGACAAVFFMPADVYRTGEKVLRLIDDEFNNIENSRTNGNAKFYSQGQVDTKQEQIVTVFVPTSTQTSVTEQTTDTVTSVKSVTNTTTKNNVVIGYYDPLAQTFLINPNQYPQGIVIDSVRVCFKTKDVSEPVTCQIRPVNNGYPSSAVIYPYAEKTLTPDEVNITDIPDLGDANKYTEFKFDVPVLLLPGEHSFVLVSNSNGYECYVAQIGGTDIRTSVKISEQPYTGSLFLSQNGSTWTADQELDIMFSIQKRVFSQNSGQAFFEADLSGYSSNTVFDTLNFMSTDATVLNTNISYDFIAQPESGDSQPFLPIIPNLDYDCVDGYGRRILSKTIGNTSFQLRATLSTTNSDISPMIDISRLNLLTIENKINNMELQNTGFIIVNQGSGYTTNGSVIFSYPDGAVGQGAGGAARAVTDGDKITRIELTNAGTGYLTSPILQITGGGGSGATAVYNGEDKSSGGNSNIRYITKRVKLASGFEAGDLRVYMDVYRPPGSGILVYYKLLSDSDSASFDDNNYQLMTEFSDTLNVTSTAKNDFFEAIYAPGTYGTGEFDNKVSYLSANGSIDPYTDFSLFAIKVVMYGTSTVNVPKISQLRVVALPASTT
jgi:hypothetical protein